MTSDIEKIKQRVQKLNLSSNPNDFWEARTWLLDSVEAMADVLAAVEKVGNDLAAQHVCRQALAKVAGEK